MYLIIYKISKILERIDMWLHRINAGRIIAYHAYGMTKVRVESWMRSKQIIYFEGPLIELRKIPRKFRAKLYKQRVYVVGAENDKIIVQIYKENPKLEKLIKEKLDEYTKEIAQ